MSRMENVEAKRPDVEMEKVCGNRKYCKETA